MGSNVLGDETYSLSVSERASDQTQQAFNCIQYWLELFMLKTFASHTFLITACAIQTKKNLGLETGCHSHRSFKACKSNMYAMNWPHKTLSLTSGRNSWGRNLWNLPSRQLRNISASVWEEPKKHATGNCHWNLWWFWRGKNFELKLVILVPVSFWAELYQQIHLSIFCVIFKGMRPVAGVLLDLTRRTMSFQHCVFLCRKPTRVSARFHRQTIFVYTNTFFFATGFSKRLRCCNVSWWACGENLGLSELLVLEIRRRCGIFKPATFDYQRAGVQTYKCLVVDGGTG